MVSAFRAGRLDIAMKMLVSQSIVVGSKYRKVSHTPGLQKKDAIYGIECSVAHPAEKSKGKFKKNLGGLFFSLATTHASEKLKFTEL